MRPHLIGPLLAAALAFATPALATTITLSEMSSDGTDASFLAATLVFTDLGGGQLELEVTNDTSSPNEYDINFVAFNLDGATVTSIVSVASPDSGWTLGGPASVDGFGSFEFHLIDGTGPGATDIGPGETKTFVLAYTGTLGAGILEANPAPHNKMVSAKFVRGPGANAADECPPFTEECPDEDSAFGASGSGSIVPEPLTAWLLVTGLGGLLAAGRRRA